MRIREVEEKTGMVRANIRYYEKEGLLCSPLREENGYREYSMEDVEQLKLIRALREVNVPMEDIKLYRDDREKLLFLLKERFEEVEHMVNRVFKKK